MSSARLHPHLLLVVVLVAGAGTMAVELAAVRLLAPWFGAAAAVWTNVIGVILLALALGYLIGARLSRGARPARTLGRVLALSAAVTVWLPYGAGPVAELFLPSALALDEAAGLLVWGSLASSLVLFLPPALLLGCVGPLAVEILQVARGGHAGDAGGRVLASSTMGSLAGTFGTTHLLVPLLGIERTFLTAAAALALCAALVLFATRRLPLDAAAAGLVLVFGMFASRIANPELQPGWRLLEERQSPYQTVRVVELPAAEGETRGLRYLQVNESFDSFQSVGAPAPGLLPPGFYYDHFAPPAYWERAPESWRVLVLGLGAGTVVRVLEGVLPATTALETVGVEIDPVVVALGERWFDLQPEAPGRRVLAGLDARAPLRWVGAGYDQVVLDCYANAVEMPPHLSSVEFFAELSPVLRDGGWVSLNAAGFGLDDPVVAALAQSLADGLGERVLGTRVPFSRNCVLHARKGADPPEPGSRGWVVEHAELAVRLAPLELPGAWCWFEPGAAAGVLLTDDRNPIERLQLESIAAGRRRWLDG